MVVENTNLITRELLADSGDWKNVLEGMEGHPVALSNWIQQALEGYAHIIIPESSKYEFNFTKLEIILTLWYASQWEKDHEWESWGPLGILPLPSARPPADIGGNDSRCREVGYKTRRL